MTSKSLSFRTINLTTAKDKLAEGEVSSASNIDFGREFGAAITRRGTTPVNDPDQNRISIVGAVSIARHYIDPYSIGSSKWYTATPTATYRNLTQIGAGGAHVPMRQFKDWMIISTESGGIMDNGATTIPWIGHAPLSAPTIAVQNAPLYQPTGAWTAPQSTTWTPDYSGNGGIAEGASKIVIQFVPNSTNFDLAKDSIFYIDISLSNTDVTVTQEWSIGDADFKNVMRAQCTPGEPTSLFADPGVVVDIADASLEERERMLEEMRMHARMPSTALSLSPNIYGVWAVQRPMFEMSSSVAANWANIGAVRYIVEGEGDLMVGIRNLAVSNTTGYPLNDPNSGYVWWETWATLEDGRVVRESAPSPPSARTPMQAARASITLPSSPPTGHGYTHRRVYRQGGYMRDAYLVAQVPLDTTTLTDAKSDVDALLENVRMVRDVYHNAEFGGYATCFSEPFYGRLVFGFENRVYWSEPNMPGMFKRTSWAEVSHSGDHVQAIVNWGPILVIINRDSIYEMDGEMRVQRSNSPRGSKSKTVPCATPYGIPVLDYDGLHFYQPGSGNTIQYDWIQRAVGNLSSLLNHSYINHSFAVWADNRLYLGIPTSGSSVNTILVFDFIHQTTSLWQYPYTITAAYWSQVDNQLIIGTQHGLLHANSKFDPDDWTPSATIPVDWNLETGLWTFVPESRLMNMGVDWRGAAQMQVSINGGAYSTVLSSSGARRRELPTASGALYNTASFRFSGQGEGGVYVLEWDAYDEVPKVLFARSPYTRFDTDIRLSAVTIHADALSSEVTVRVYVNGTVAHTTTITGTGPKGYTITIPETVGASAFVELESTTPFRFYELRFHGEPEPAVVTHLRVDEKIYEAEQEFKAWAANMDCLNNTVTVKVYIDATLITTFQVSGNGRRGYVRALPASGPVHPMGRHIWAEYDGGPFRHYATWYEVKAEPSRLHHFRTEPDMRAEEHEWKAFSYVLEGTATASVYIDGALITSTNVSGAGVKALPPKTFGRTAYIVYSASTPFKHYGTTWTARQEPPRLLSFRTDPDIRTEEQEWKAVSYVLWGTADANVYIDEVLVKTETVSGEGVITLPPLTFGRTAYVTYTAASPFKHYTTAFTVKQEPHRLRSFRTEPDMRAEEHEWQAFSYVLEGSASASVYIDGTLVSTINVSGAGVQALPPKTFGRTAYVIYSSPTTPFKHYGTSWTARQEPPRLLSFRTTPETRTEEQEWKAVSYVLEGTATADVYIDEALVKTEVVSGAGVITLPTLTFGRTAYVIYSSSTTPFKHYTTSFTVHQEPHRLRSFRTEPDMRAEEHEWKAFSYVLEGSATAKAYIDGALITTVDVSGAGVQALPPKTFGRTAYVIYTSTTPFKHYGTSWTARQEPPRLLSFRTDPDMRTEEQEWKAVSYVLWGTAEAKVYIDEVLVKTETVSDEGVITLPPLTFGRTAYVTYTASSPFKHYTTAFTVKQEPHRLHSFRTEPDMRAEEHEWKAASYVLEGSATASVYIDGGLVVTANVSGAGVITLPPLTYGRTAYVIYSSTTPFKHYGTSWTAVAEPPRVTSWVFTNEPLPSKAVLKTLVSVLDCLGGTVQAQVQVDGVVVKSVELSGTGRTTYNTALEAEGASVRVFYSSSTPFKHHSSVVEMSPEPFLKDSWFFQFTRIGGFVSFVYPRRYNLDLEGEGNVTVEWLNQDGVFHTATHLLHGRTYLTWQPFPANIPSTLMRCRITSSEPFRVYAVSMDVEYNTPTRTARATIRGTPDEQA